MLEEFMTYLPWSLDMLGNIVNMEDLLIEEPGDDGET